MSTSKGFLCSVLSALILLGMMTGLYNPRRETSFTPPPVRPPAVYGGPALTLIEGGVSEYVIVLGAEASKPEITAAEKLRGFLLQISGAELEIVPDSAPARAKELVVGGTNRYAMDEELEQALGTDGFIIKTIDEKIILSGGRGQPRGTLYSVYDFLEKFLGCRWLGKTVTVIPEQATVKVPLEIDEYEVPAFIYRQPSTLPRVNGRDGYTREDDVDYSLANRVNAQGMIGNSTNEEEVGGIITWPVTHSALAILPPGVYIEEHPEYFAKNEDGSAIPCEHGENNPCLTNPEVIEIYKKYALDIMENNPDTQGISMGLNDSGTICLCTDCRALYAEEDNGKYFEHVKIPLASQSRALMEVLNQVCEALEEAGYTEVTINAFAYGTATYAPSIDLHEQIVIHFCPINMCYVHGPEECEYWENRYYFGDVLKGWGKIAKRITIFEYPLSYNEPGAAYPVWGQVQNYLQFYYENSAVGLTQCTASIYDVNFYEMTGYIYARLLWDPYLDLEALYEDFLPLYFGGGWQYIREYLRFTAEEASGREIGGVTYHTNSLEGSTKTGMLAMTNREIKYIDHLWDRARALAGSELCLNNVRRAELSWRMWKSDNFRGEFWFFNLAKSRTKENKKLFDDFWELLATPKLVDGVLTDDLQIWYNSVDWWITQDDFYALKAYRLWPKMWSWRQLGRDGEGVVTGFWDLLYKSIL
ncbi:MAG: DUF4838 domain-containing protein [Oscillospiraceae bacterium]|nr:DUF4838 domain-containing protein [Oscillospiraceae bacterium]